MIGTQVEGAVSGGNDVSRGEDGVGSSAILY